MAISVNSINTASDTFSVWVNRTNEIANLLSTAVLTANTNANGSSTTGNSFLNGILGATTIAVTTLRGGNVQSSANLTISTNTFFTGTLANVIGLSVNSTIINSTSNATFVTGQLTLSQNFINLGNSTVNVSINSSSFNVGNTSLITENQRISVANVGSVIGTRKTLNLIANGAVNLNISDDANNNQVTVEMSLTTNVGVSGANTNIQFNNSGNFGGSNAFSFNTGTNVVSISNRLDVGNTVAISNNIFNSIVNYTSSNTSSQIIDSFFIADYRTAEYTVSINNNSANAVQAQKLLLIHSGGTSNLTSYAVLRSNSSLGTFDANSNTTHVRLVFTPTAANTTVKCARTLIGV